VHLKLDFLCVLDLCMRWTGLVARMGKWRDICSVLVGKPERKRPLGRPRLRWEDNIKIDLQEVRCDNTDCVDLAHFRDGWPAFVNAVMNPGVP
jgi:hypothetical protein